MLSEELDSLDELLLEQSTWTALMEGLVRKKYQFLLGAGFSRDVTDRLNRPLPGGAALKDELVAEFALPLSPGEEIDLGRAYEAAARRTSVNGQSLAEWLKFRFSQTNPPEWFGAFSAIPAIAVWTLNIDDSLEQALPEIFMSKSFSDKHATPTDGRTPLIHLHGDATRSDPQLIFSLAEYRRYVTQPRSYALQFQESLSDDPIIVLGAALTHETDLAQALRDKALNRDAIFPSVIVKPNPSALEREEFESWGLHVVDATAEDFITRVQGDLRATQIALAPTLAAEGASTPLAMRFSQQWTPYSPTAGSSLIYRDFLSGAEPVPNDVLRGDTVDRAKGAEVTQSLEAGDQPVLLHGLPFGGKSTLITRIASDFNSKGWRVFYFSADDRLDVKAAVSQATTVAHTLFVVDDAGLFANDLKDLVLGAQEKGVALRLLCCDRTGPASRLLRWGVFTEYVLSSRMVDREIKSFYDLLARRDRLNARWRRTSAERALPKLRKESWTDYSSIICETVLGETFEDRVRKDYRALSGHISRGAYLLGCLLARASKGVPVGLAAAAMNVTPRKLEQVVQDMGMMDSLCVIQRGKIRPRHRRHAEVFLAEVVSGDEAFLPLVGLAKALAPNLDIAAIRNSTLHYRISVELLDQEMLARILGAGRLENFYSDIEDAYSWNSRFWEQRALAASSVSHHGNALEYSRKALSAHRDAFSLNTAASVQFRAIWSAPRNLDAWDREFWRVMPNLRESRDLAREDSEYPFVTFFTAAVRFAKEARRDGRPVSEALAAEWKDWFELADRSQAFRDAKGSTKSTNSKQIGFASCFRSMSLSLGRE